MTLSAWGRWLVAHTCVEATVRYAAELGFEVTMVEDATASHSGNARPNYAPAIVTTNEIVDLISSL